MLYRDTGTENGSYYILGLQVSGFRCFRVCQFEGCSQQVWGFRA